MIKTLLLVSAISGCIGAKLLLKPAENFEPYTNTYNIVYDYAIDTTLVDSVGESYTFMVQYYYDESVGDFEYTYTFFSSQYNYGYQPSYSVNYSNMITLANRSDGLALQIYCAISNMNNGYYGVFTSYVLGSYYSDYYTKTTFNQFLGYDFTDYDQMNYYRDGRAYFTGAYDSTHQYNWCSDYYMNSLISITPVNNKIPLSWDIMFAVDYTKNSTYMVGYNDGAKDGYNNGKIYGREVGYSEGYSEGFEDGDIYGYNRGLQDGDSSSGLQLNLLALFGGIADTPVRLIVNLFDFDFFGVSALTIFMSMLTALIVIHFIRKIWN